MMQQCVEIVRSAVLLAEHALISEHEFPALLAESLKAILGIDYIEAQLGRIPL
jgi:hypothetical protein